MGLNEVMARLGEQKVSQPPKEQGMILSRHERDRITEALRIAKRCREAELRIAKQTKEKEGKSETSKKRKDNQMATLRKQITDYNQLIFKLRNETARLQSDGIR